MDRCPERNGQGNGCDGLLVRGVMGWDESESGDAAKHEFCDHGLTRGLSKAKKDRIPGDVSGILWDSFFQKREGLADWNLNASSLRGGL